MEWDVFISHASEDRDDFVRPLADRLQQLGLSVWFDEITITVGDSLRRSIDRGLAKSRYGIIVISPSFLEKDWLQRELNGLVLREINGTKVILPIWHNVGGDEIREYSPMLADRMAANSSKGIEFVADQLMLAIRQETGVVQMRASKAAIHEQITPRRSPILSGNTSVGPLDLNVASTCTIPVVYAATYFARKCSLCRVNPRPARGRADAVGTA